MGHRDAIPDDDEEFRAWAKNLIEKSEANKEKWGIPDGEIERMKTLFEGWEKFLLEPDPPPEPNPVDGWTIYWDKEKRLRELMADYLAGIGLDISIWRDAALGKADMSVLDEAGKGWSDYLLEIVQANVGKYGVKPERVEEIRKKLAEPVPAAGKDGAAPMEWYLLTLTQSS